MIKLHSRLDIFVKVLYIKGYLEGENYDLYRTLYVRHISLFNLGIEDHKTSVEDFIRDFEYLIDNFKKSGFDPAYPIHVDSDGHLINGAHRLACSLYFGIDPVTKVISTGRSVTRGLDWFKKNGFGEMALITILECYKKFQPLDVIVIWPAYKNKIDTITRFMTEHSISTLGSFSLPVTKFQFLDFVNDIYSYDSFIEKNRIYNKALELVSIDSSFEILLIDSNAELIKHSLKSVLRTMIVDEGDSLYNTFHFGDDVVESTYLTDIIINRSNIKHLKLRKKKVDASFYSKLEHLDAFMTQQKKSKKLKLSYR